MLQLVLVSAAASGKGVGWSSWFESEETEIDTPVKLQINGTLPQWLRGTLLRTGSGKYEYGKHKYNHAFDGYAKLSRFHFTADGDLVFSTRFVDTGVLKVCDVLYLLYDMFMFLKESKAAGDISPHLTFMQPVPKWPITRSMKAMKGASDLANINIWRTGNVTCELRSDLFLL